MNYLDFENAMSQPRMQRYLAACGNDSAKAITLYRLNLELSKELFPLIGCFEVALRNAIDKKFLQTLGRDWLKNAAAVGGRFDNTDCTESQRIINETMQKIGNGYNHQKLLTELGLGFWRHLFAYDQYKALGDPRLKDIFPFKPRSQPHSLQYKRSTVYNMLACINEIRNRIAHHEPICFKRKDKYNKMNIKDITDTQNGYNQMLQLFQWMNIDASELLYSPDCVNEICSRINSL